MYQPTAPIFVIGAAITDFMAFARYDPQVGDSVPGELVTAPGGVGRNVAENLARLGVPVELVTAFGDSRIGWELRESCRSVGMGITHSATVQQQRGATHVAVLDPRGDLFAGIADLSILDRLTPAYFAEFKEPIDAADTLFIETNLPQGTIDWFIRQPWQPSIMVDPVSEVMCQKIRPHLARIHTLKCNLRQAEVLTGRTISTPAEAEQAARGLHQSGISRVIVTLGADGVVGAGAQDTFHQSARAARIVNTTGAGDAFSAGYLWAIRQGYDLPTACQYGQWASVITLSDACACSPDLSVAALRAAALPV